MIRNCVLFFLILVLVTACSPKTLSGLYDTDQAYQMSMAGEIIEFLPDQQFFYKRWSDNISSNIKGKGRYEIKEGNLLLQFAAYEAEETVVTTKALENEPNGSIKLELFVSDHANMALIGVPVLLKNEAGEMLTKGITNGDGKCGISLANAVPHLEVALSYVGFMDTHIDLDGSSSQAIEVKMIEKIQYFAAGTELAFRLKGSSDRLILMGENGKRVFYKVRN